MKTKMEVPFTQVPNELLRSKNLDCYDKMVFSLIASCGNNAFPGYKALREWCGISNDRLWKSLRNLETNGVIKRYLNGRSVQYQTYWTSPPDVVKDMKPIRYTELSVRQTDASIRSTEATHPPDGAEPIRQTDTINTQDTYLLKREEISKLIADAIGVMPATDKTESHNRRRSSFYRYTN